MRHRTRAGGATLRQGLLVVLLAAVTGTATVPALAQPPAADATALQAAHRIEAQLEGTYAAMERLTEQADAAAERQKDLRQAQADLETRRSATIDRLAIAQAQLDREARAVYMAGPEFFVSELIGSATPEDALRRLPLQRRVLEADAAVVTAVKDEKARLDQLSARMAMAIAEQRKITDTFARLQRQIQGLTGQLQAIARGTGKDVLALIAQDQQQTEAARRTAWAAYMTSLRASGHGPLGTKPSALALRALGFALRQLGKPYQWGAQGPDRYDCSGLTSAAYAAAGWSIPRTAAEQFGAGAHVAVSELLPGDLVFFADDPSAPWTIHHVGMYAGGGLMVEAPHTGAFVRLASIWRPDYAGAVRVVAGVSGPGVPLPPRGAPTTTTRPPVMTTLPPTTTKPRATTTTKPPTITTKPPASTAPPSTAPPTTVPPLTTVPPTTTTTTTAAATTTRS